MKGKSVAFEEDKDKKMDSHQIKDIKEFEYFKYNMELCCFCGFCEQVCPTQAISFGDLNDGKSVVAKQASNPRAYKLLEALNIKPRVSYLARIRNPNPELVGA